MAPTDYVPVPVQHDGEQAYPAIATTANDNTVIVWSGAGQGVDYGIFAQAYARPVNLHRSGFEPDEAACAR